MHVIDALSADFYEIERGGQPGTPADVFANWNEHDRFGIVLYEPLAGLGATHLIQLVCTMFYDVKPVRRTDRKIYPELFAIHVGDWWGGHGNFDFWPPRREVQVSRDHQAVLGAINDRGITRLAIPERPVRDIAHRRKEEDCALDGLVTAVMYSPGGRVEQPDFAIRSVDARSERDVQKVIRPIEIAAANAARIGQSAVPVKEGDPDFSARQRELNVNVTDALREAATRRRSDLRDARGALETYRFVDPAEALKRL